jgi:hypothetical protein
MLDNRDSSPPATPFISKGGDDSLDAAGTEAVANEYYLGREIHAP